MDTCTITSHHTHITSHHITSYHITSHHITSNMMYVSQQKLIASLRYCIYSSFWAAALFFTSVGLLFLLTRGLRAIPSLWPPSSAPPVQETKDQTMWNQVIVNFNTAKPFKVSQLHFLSIIRFTHLVPTCHSSAIMCLAFLFSQTTSGVTFTPAQSPLPLNPDAKNVIQRGGQHLEFVRAIFKFSPLSSLFWSPVPSDKVGFSSSTPITCKR